MAGGLTMKGTTGFVTRTSRAKLPLLTHPRNPATITHMTTAVAKSPTATTTESPKRCRLVEKKTVIPSEVRVDEEALIIRGVKVVGLQSRNPASVLGLDSDEPYSYSQEALEEATPLYEGAVVNIDHPEFTFDKDGERHVVGQHKTAQRFGRLINARFVRGSGIVADLEYLKSHPLAEMIVEIAKRMPETLALSHHGDGELSRQPDGSFAVTKITGVSSVDLIAEKPGTTKSLFEAATSPDKEVTMPIDEKDDVVVAENQDPSTIAVAKERRDDKLAMTEEDLSDMVDEDDIIEEEAIVDDDEEVVESDEEMVAPEAEDVVEEEAPVAEPTPEDMIDGGFKAAILKLLDSDIDNDTLKSKVGDLITQKAATMETLAGDVAPEDSEELTEEDMADKEEEGKSAAMAESFIMVRGLYQEQKRENEKLAREMKARDILESKGIQRSPAKVRLLVSTDGDDEAQAELFEAWTPKKKTATKQVARPAKTGRAVELAESAAVNTNQPPKDVKDLMSRVSTAIR